MVGTPTDKKLVISLLLCDVEKSLTSLNLKVRVLCDPQSTVVKQEDSYSHQLGWGPYTPFAW